MGGSAIAGTLIVASYPRQNTALNFLDPKDIKERVERELMKRLGVPVSDGDLHAVPVNASTKIISDGGVSYRVDGVSLASNNPVEDYEVEAEVTNPAGMTLRMAGVLDGHA